MSTENESKRYRQLSHFCWQGQKWELFHELCPKERCECACHYNYFFASYTQPGSKLALLDVSWQIYLACSRLKDFPVDVQVSLVQELYFLAGFPLRIEEVESLISRISYQQDEDTWNFDALVGVYPLKKYFEEGTPLS